LASIITGQYAHQHKVTSNDPPLPEGAKRNHPDFKAGRERMNQFMDAAPALPRLLGERGYLSFQAGKWWQGDFKRGGFTHGMTKGSRHGDDGLKIGRETMQPVFDFMEEATKDGKPFMVWYAPMMPHNPHNPPKRLLEKYEGKTPSKQVAKYWAMVEWFDETCGALMNRLDEMKIADNTIVVYVTDNGWIQNPDKGEYAARSKQSPNEGGIRTPIMVRWLGKVKPEMSEQLASSLDITPTLLKAAGLSKDPSMPGIDLLDAPAVTNRKALFGEIFHHSAVDLDKPASSLRYRWMIDGQWKVIEPRKELEPDAKVELYDLAADPHENTDLAAKEPARVEAMLKTLDVWWTPN
jgi:arylsulfatase A-like enzyme